MEPVLPFALELESGTGPLTRRLHQQLRAAILDGRLSAGTQLPSTRRLACGLGISRNTVVTAYDLLVAEGYLVSHAGATARVANLVPRPTDESRPVLASVSEARLGPSWRLQSPLPAPTALPERSFRLGIPDHRHFPHALWRRLWGQGLREWSRTPFGYGPAEGVAPLRQAIASHVAFSRAVACQAGDVLVTSGAQQAFDLLARLLVTPAQTRVAIEEPGYPPLRAAFAQAGAVLVPVPVDDEGLCVDALPRDVQVISVTPSHQSPTGAALSLRRRRALLDFARQRDAVVIEDDYDGEFRFGGRPLDALQTLDHDQRVFYVGTFSKSLFPSLRMGFVVAPAWARRALVAAKHCADSGCDELTQTVLARFILDGHLVRHVRRMRNLYAARRNALLQGLRSELAPWLEPIAAEAGLHLSARLLNPSCHSAIMAQVRRHAPGAQSTNDYAMSPLPQPAVAFGYGTLDAQEIPMALRRLGRALRALR